MNWFVEHLSVAPINKTAADRILTYVIWLRKDVKHIFATPLVIFGVAVRNENVVIRTQADSGYTQVNYVSMLTMCYFKCYTQAPLINVMQSSTLTNIHLAKTIRPQRAWVNIN